PKAAVEAPKAAEPAPKAAKAEPAPEPAKAAEPAPAKAAGRLSDAALDAYDEARTLHRSDPQRALTLYAEAARRGNVAAWRQIGTLQAQLGDKPAAIAAFKKYRAVAPGARDSQMVADVIRRLGGTPE
ncbi:MAG: hypothetical protein KC635_30110, partial [Myxococcales bacterium]|nr:hypothetical protein [Myxococcales bacterium]